MKALFLASAAVFGLFGASALASDLPTKAPDYKTPIAAPPYNWSGFYVGANFGAGWTTGSLNIPDNNFYGGTTEFIGGVQAGYNFQAGHLLFGVEGDFDGARQELKKVMATYVKYPPRKLQSYGYTGPITLSNYERFEWVREQLKKEGVSIGMPTGN